MAFKHKDFLEKLAKRAEVSDTPWDQFQERKLGEDWADLTEFPILFDTSEYRRKPAAINVNGFEFDDPIDYELPNGSIYYTPNLNVPDHNSAYTEWKKGAYPGLDANNLANELIHLEMESAINHAKAMLSLTTKKVKPKVKPDGKPSPTEP